MNLVFDLSTIRANSFSLGDGLGRDCVEEVLNIFDAIAEDLKLDPSIILSEKTQLEGSKPPMIIDLER